MLALTVGDTLPTQMTYRCAKGSVVNITGYSFVLRVGMPTVLLKNAEVVNGPEGLLQIPWAANDLVEGSFDMEMTVRDTAGKEKTHKLGDLVVARRLS